MLQIYVDESTRKDRCVVKVGIEAWFTALQRVFSEHPTGLSDDNVGRLGYDEALVQLTIFARLSEIAHDCVS